MVETSRCFCQGESEDSRPDEKDATPPPTETPGTMTIGTEVGTIITTGIAAVVVVVIAGTGDMAETGPGRGRTIADAGMTCVSCRKPRHWVLKYTQCKSMSLIRNQSLNTFCNIEDDEGIVDSDEVDEEGGPAEARPEKNPVSKVKSGF